MWIVQNRQAVSAGAMKGARAMGGAAVRSADVVGEAGKAMSAGAKKVQLRAGADSH
jgi:hypothetical protein